MQVLKQAILIVGREFEPRKGSKEIQEKRKKKDKKGKKPSFEGRPQAKDEGRSSGQADYEAVPESSPLSLEATQTREHDINQTSGKAKLSVHGKQGQKGAEIGAALQKGLLGTVMRPEEPLAPGWD